MQRGSERSKGAQERVNTSRGLQSPFPRNVSASRPTGTDGLGASPVGPRSGLQNCRAPQGDN